MRGRGSCVGTGKLTANRGMLVTIMIIGDKMKLRGDHVVSHSKVHFATKQSPAWD